MSDRERMLDLLRERGPDGVTTFELRRRGFSGNPSQRKAELEERGHRIAVEPYAEGKRQGRRYILSEAQSSGRARSGTPLPSHASAARLSPRRELVWSFICGERPSWIRTNCPPEGKLPHVDSLAQGELWAA